MGKRYGHATSRNTAQGYVYKKNGHDKLTNCTHILSQIHKVKYSNKLYLKTFDIDGVRLLSGIPSIHYQIRGAQIQNEKICKIYDSLALNNICRSRL